MEATTKDLRLHTRELLAAVGRGEQVAITYRGKPCARLVAWQEGTQEVRRGRNPAFGLWRGQQDIPVDEQVRALRRGRDFSDLG
ncbi:prevent-host-death family protein [Ectothiorhodospira haloalkaliphila]|uniref:Prevent-host-death family protein n=1 Tax=Ectothiorhodospira haloalkaliphila TaxID=421628 RepID=W8KKL9_9GAMM|nr:MULTISPECIES: type II toxin-antitoxin system prevent-host-death family antitoxin [Ectothiorhodospira]AHK79668.1 prevent-host-death family protein [Ectothiorhodospira haloalkaliphila]MCG5494400.1 type II toxin-antitoxin system prevent-host-death family antitoxin [Ectothiorhodospira variabilis]MCG5498691.1 type II toxin-antitoxin system prevent-host-death family antitoxin [Ectothiorhodospira variabilis]MCG5503229.1 type II toxin-antitoxin system prevent-host-death family antitoxin [Ectothiorho